MTINIREATIDDAPILGRLLMTVQHLHYEEMPHRYRPLTADDPDVITYFEGILATQGNTIFIAWEDDTALGYISCQYRNIPDHVLVWGGRQVHIDQMSVEAEVQGQGIGQALMERASQFARDHGVSRITLGVIPFNKRAIRFYERFGFTVRTYRMELIIDQ